jgi:hypothetical protein
MPPKQQQKLTFGSSSSSNKRVRDELSPPPEHASPDVLPFAHSGIWEGGSKGPVYRSLVFADNFQDYQQEVADNHTNFASKLQSLFDTVSEQNAIITKLQEQVNELVSRPPPISTSLEVGQPLVQPHPQQKPPQPRAPRLNKNIPGKATTTPTPTPAPNTPPTATLAKVDADAGFTTVTNKKKKKPTTLLPPPQPTAE